MTAGVCLFPFCLMLASSFKMGGHFTLRQYGVLLLQTPGFFTGFWNSVLYTLVILLVNIPLSLLAAYGFSRFHFKGRDLLFWVYIVMMLMPFQATVVPQYITLKALGVINTPWSVVLPNMFATFGTFLMTQYMRGFDPSIYEAAQIDGASNFRIFYQLVLPVCKPVILAMIVLSFVNYWSLVEQPMLFLENASQQPLSVRLNGTTFGDVSFAAGVVFSILPMLLYLYSYNDLQNGIGITASGKRKSDGKILKTKQRNAIKKLSVATVAILVAATFATQKISDIMMPRVSVYTIGRKAPVLRGYATVVPQQCVLPGDPGGQVLTTMPSSFDGATPQAVGIHVTVLAEEGGYCAIAGTIPNNSKLICYTSKPVHNGDLVKIVEEAYDEGETS